MDYSGALYHSFLFVTKSDYSMANFVYISKNESRNISKVFQKSDKTYYERMESRWNLNLNLNLNF